MAMMSAKNAALSPASASLGLGDQLQQQLADEEEERQKKLLAANNSAALSPATMSLLGTGKATG